MAESTNPIFERDSILLYCTEKKGFLYVGTDNPSNAALTLHPVRNPNNLQFPYLAFAVFKLFVVPEIETRQKKDDGNPLVFGRLVKLFNLASQKFVALSAKSKSREKDSSVFVIRSPQGTESRGRDVCLGSEIRLESANNRGACLSFDYDVTTKSLHAHLKGIGMKFVVYRHAKESELSDELLMAGKPVMLHNLKRDGELSANGCFLRTDGDESDRTVECRRRTRVHGVERIPPQSGDTFWLLELMDAPYNGRPLKWNDRCRIQHLPSQLYVTVVEVPGIHNMYQVKLQELNGEDSPRNESFILMHPTDDDASGTISHTDNLVFQHEITERRIAVPVTTKEINLRHRFYSNNRRLNVFTVQKDTMSGMTVFLVDQITQVVVSDFYSATAWASNLHKVAEKLRISESVNFDYMKRFKDHMSSVVTWIQEGQIPSRRADMLRTLHVVEVLYDLLRDCSELVDGSEASETDISRYKVMLQSIVDTMKKFIQIAKPKTRRYFIQDEILKPLFLKPTSRAAVEDFLSLLVKVDTVVADKMSDFIFKHDLAPAMQVERESQGFLMSLSTNSHSKNASKIQNLLFMNMQNYPLGIGRTPEDDVQLETVARSAETIAQYSGTTIDRFWKTYEFERLTLSEPWRGAGVRSAFKRVEKPCVIQEMQRNITEHLRANGTIRVTKDSVQKNSYTSQFLGMLESLVNYGFYSAEDQLKIIPHLLYIIDGSTDYYPQKSGNRLATRTGTVIGQLPPQVSRALDRYKDTNENRPVIKIKNVGVRVLQKFHNMLVYISLERLLYDFKHLLEQTNYHHMEESIQDTHVCSRQRVPYYEKLRICRSEEDILSASTSAYHLIAPPKNLTELLNPNLRSITKSVQANAKGRLDALFDDDSYSIFNTSSSQGKHLVRVLLDLLNYNDGELCLSAAQLLFDMHCKKCLVLNSARDAYLVDPVMSGFLNKVLPLASMSDEEKILHEMFRGIVQPEANPQLLDTLDELCIECVKQSDENEPAISQQSILYSSGLFLLLLDYVMKYGPSNDKSHIECKMRCYELMRRITRKNPKVQFRIYQDFADVMKEKVCVFAMAELLTEVFSYNERLCVVVCELDTGLKEFLTEAISSAHCDQHELVHVMNVVVMGNPRCRDQVAKLIKDARDSDLSHLLHEDRAARMQLLCLKHNEASDEDQSNLCLLLNIVDVLATCCIGEFLKSEVIAEEIIPFDEILEIIAHPRIPLENKKPFTALLNWAFLETERDSLQYLKQVMLNTNFKQHLEDIALLINAFMEDSQQINLTEVRKNLKTLGKRHLSVAGWMKYCCNSPVVTITSGDHSTSLNGMLLYLLQGLIPLITVLSVKLERLDVFPEMILVLKGFGESLMKFQRLLLNQPEHAEVTMACLNGIGSMLHGNLPTDVHAGFMLGLQRSRLSVQSMQPRDAKTNCALLNDKLQEYVTNYWIACGGMPSSDYESNGMYTFPINSDFDKLVDLFDMEDGNIDDEEINLKNILKLLDIIYAKIHRQIKGTERSELDVLLFITLQIVVTLLQRKVDMVEYTESRRMRREVYEQCLEPLQDHLLKLHAHEKIMKHLSHPIKQISFQVITIMKQLLFFGNTQAQELIGGLLSSDKSDVLFSKFRTILEGIGSQLIIDSEPSGPIPLEMSLEPGAALRSRRTSSSVPPSPSAVHYFKRNTSHGITSPMTATFQFASLANFEEGTIQEENVTGSNEKTNTGSSQSLLESSNTTCDEDVPLVESKPRTKANTATNSTINNAENLEVNESDDEDAEDDNEPLQGTQLQASGRLSSDCANDEVNVVLDVVSFLCDGQRKELQDTFGRETPHFAGCNIMNHITLVLEGVADSIDHKNINTARKAFQALIELCAGNFRNQELAFRLQALASINSFLKINLLTFDLDLQSEIMLVKCSAVELLEVMLEETDPLSSELAKKIYAQLIIKNLMTTMVQMWTCYNMSTIKADQSFWRNGLLRCYHTIKMIAHYTGIKPEDMVKDKFRHVFGRKNSDVQAMLFFCREWSHSIEIEYKPKGILTRVYFPFPPKQHLDQEDKEWVSNNLSRESEDEKLRDLLRWTESLRKRSLWKTKVHDRMWLRWVTKFSNIRHFALIFLTIIMNLLLIIALSIKKDQPSTSTLIHDLNITNIDETQWYFPTTVASLGSIYFLLAVWMVAEFYINEYPHIRPKSRILDHLLWYLSRRMPKLITLLNSLYYRLFKRHFAAGKPQPYGHFERPLFDLESAYRIMFLLGSLLSLPFHGIFYPLCLGYLFLKSDFAITVVDSVSKSAKALVIILLLVLMILVIYAVVAFLFFNKFFQDDSQNLRCGTMFECLVTVVMLGSLSNPPLGDNIKTFSDNSFVTILRLLYSISFFVIVTTLGLNIVIAILVDNFSALREKKNEIELDKLTVCTICGLNKSFLDHSAKMQGGFREHIKEAHSMWNYIYFAMYLDYRDRNDHNALEKYIFESMRNREIDFFPRGKAKGVAEE